jgi:hypothetical protein
MLQVESATLQHVEVGVVQAHRTRRILRPDERQQVLRRAVVLQVGKDELLGRLAVLGVDAHRPEQLVILGETDHIAPDAAPEQGQARRFALVFLTDERAPHLEGGIHPTEEVP